MCKHLVDAVKNPHSGYRRVQLVSTSQSSGEMVRHLKRLRPEIRTALNVLQPADQVVTAHTTVLDPDSGIPFDAHSVPGCAEPRHHRASGHTPMRCVAAPSPRPMLHLSTLQSTPPSCRFKSLRRLSPTTDEVWCRSDLCPLWVVSPQPWMLHAPYRMELQYFSRPLAGMLGTCPAHCVRG